MPLLDTPKGKSGRIDRNVLSSQNLAPSPTLNLTQPKPATKAAETLGYLDAFTQNTQAQAQQRQSVADDSMQTYLKAALSSDTESGMQDKAYTQTVDPLEQELNDINSQIMAEQHALRRRIEAIRRNEQGNFGGAVEDMVNEAETESLGKQADLAVIQMSKQGKYDSAKAIADRAVQAMYEKQEKRNEALKFNYLENKDLFDKSEQRAFELMQGDRERTLEEEKAMRMAKFNQQIQQNDPLYKAQVQKIYADIAKTNSERSQAPAKEQQKIDTRVAKASSVLNKVTEALDKMGATTSGFLGGTTKYIPGSPSYSLNKTLDTIKANLGFDELQAMREASPTGGALGQVAVQELSMLQATISSLDTGLDADTLKQNLGQVEEHYVNWVAAAAPEKLGQLGYQITPEGDVVKITR